VDIAILIACIAVVISLAVFVRDNHRYRIPLEIRIPSYLVLWSEGNQALILFRLVFVNHSQSGRTVVKVVAESPTGITGIPAVWVFDKDYQNVNALLPNSGRTDSLPIDEVLHDALDISPHQSQSKWVGYVVQFPQYLDGMNLKKILDNRQIPLFFCALDVNDKALAVVEIPTILHELKTVGTYPVEYTATHSYKTRKRK